MLWFKASLSSFIAEMILSYYSSSYIRIRTNNPLLTSLGFNHYTTTAPQHHSQVQNILLLNELKLFSVFLNSQLLLWITASNSQTDELQRSLKESTVWIYRWKRTPRWSLKGHVFRRQWKSDWTENTTQTTAIHFSQLLQKWLTDSFLFNSLLFCTAIFC